MIPLFGFGGYKGKTGCAETNNDIGHRHYTLAIRTWFDVVVDD